MVRSQPKEENRLVPMEVAIVETRTRRKEGRLRKSEWEKEEYNEEHGWGYN